MRLIHLLIFMSLSWIGMAQSTNVGTFFHDNLRKANTYFDMFAYRNAQHLYKRMLDKNPYDVYARQRVGECYVRLMEYEKAADWYREMIVEYDGGYSAYLPYAEVLTTLGRVEEAIHWYAQYLERNEESTRARNRLEFLLNMNFYLRDSVLYDVNNAGINSPQSDLGAGFYFNNQLVFLSNRDADGMVKHRSMDMITEEESMYNYFVADAVDNNRYGGARLFPKFGAQTKYHDGPFSLYHYKTKIAFTRTSMVGKKPDRDIDGRANLKIFLGDIEENMVTNVVEFTHNLDGYSNGHPSMSPDGKAMYYSSTSPFGKGKSDIYVSYRLDNGRWTEPENLGEDVNTDGEELYPFLLNDSTLLFASNGHGGFGGLDVFMSMKRNGKFTKPFNLGYPLNTPYDDFSLIFDESGRFGAFSSNRPGGKGLDDIYIISAGYYSLAGTVVQEVTGHLLPRAKVEVYDSLGQQVATTHTDDEGNFFVDLPFDGNYRIMAFKDGFYQHDSLKYSTYRLPIGMDSIRLPMREHNLFASGVVYSHELHEAISDAFVVFKNLTEWKVDTVFTDFGGRYRQRIMPNRRYNVTSYKQGFLKDDFNLNTRNLVKGELKNDFVLEMEFYDKRILQFDFDKSLIKEDALADLEESIRLLKEHPEATVIISAFADATGTKEYNKALSVRRLKAVMDYMTRKGISPSRMEGHAFGEDLLLNHCSDGVECDEEDHAINRRAEVKVQLPEHRNF
jgi:outer membrane protein OmpA-like peptidoglycan-associated protein